MKFIKAKYMQNKTVRYQAETGELIDYVGGTWAWRNNNPGNIVKSPFADRHGAIGHAGGFAVFPDLEIGKEAQISLLKIKKYQEMAIWEVIKNYAPASDGNDPKNYTKLVKQFTGLDPNKKLKELDDSEFSQVIKAIIRVEGFKEGEIKPIKMKKIIDTKEEKGVLVSYKIEEYDWVDKKTAVYLAKKGIIDAVVVNGENGEFLRSKPDDTTSNNLKKK